MSYNIFLDDERFPSNSDLRDYKIVRNYKDFCELISTLGLPDFVSFDHDLDEEKTGYDCAKLDVHIQRSGVSQYDQELTISVSENKLNFRQTKWFAYSGIHYEGLGYTGGLILESGKEEDDAEYIYVIEKQFIQQSYNHKLINNTIKLKLLLNDENMQLAKLYFDDYVNTHAKPSVVRQEKP